MKQKPNKKPLTANERFCVIAAVSLQIMQWKYAVLFFIVLPLFSCNFRKSATLLQMSDGLPQQTEQNSPPSPIVIAKPKMFVDMEAMGLVDVRTLDAWIRVVLPYASSDNFTGQVLYECSQYAYLHPDVAAMLAKASRLLREKYPKYRLLVLDAARPLSVQQKMWNAVKGTPNNIYVANPSKTGLHNYGVAIDVTITDDYGIELDMGTPFDFFGPEAQPAKEKEMLKQGKLTQQQLDNRQLLRSVMNQAGLQTYYREWWHFNACTLAEAKAKYKVIP
jgi:D-alanyl-D-alanine dipeptidase